MQEFKIILLNLQDLSQPVIEIAIMAFLIYWMLRMLRGTMGHVMMVAVFVFILILEAAASLLQLQVLNWLLDNILKYLPFFLLVIFQAEIRRMLSTFGLLSLRAQRSQRHKTQQVDDKLVTALMQAIHNLSKPNAGNGKSTGALIAIEQKVGLRVYADMGRPIGAPLIPGNQLLETIFYNGTPLHDGGVIIKDGVIVAASCVFPLCENRSPEQRLGHGMRHQAAIGLSEQSDALVLVVSEETGNVSVAMDGRLTQMKDEEQLKGILNQHLQMTSTGASNPFATLYQQLVWLPRLLLHNRKQKKQKKAKEVEQ